MSLSAEPMIDQLPLALPHRTALGAADFLVAPPNAAAVAWLDRWPRWPGPTLVLAGPPGSGKTHLGQVFRARSGAALIDSGELAVARVPALVGAAVAAILDEAQSVDEQALLHLHNVLAERGGHLLVLTREPPSRWHIALPDLRSRLLAAPVAMLAPPDDVLLAAVLLKLLADRQLVVGEDVVSYLLVRLERSFAAVQQAVAAIDQAALAAKRRITVPLVRAVLKDEG